MTVLFSASTKGRCETSDDTNLKGPEFMYGIVKISDYHYSVTSTWYQSTMCSTSTICDRHPCCRKKAWENPQTTLHCLRTCYGRQKHLWTLDEKWDVFRNRKRRLPHLPTSGRPATAISPEILQRVYVIVRETRRITIRQLALSISIS